MSKLTQPIHRRALFGLSLLCMGYANVSTANVADVLNASNTPNSPNLTNSPNIPNPSNVVGQITPPVMATSSSTNRLPDVEIFTFERVQGCYSENGKKLTKESVCLFADGTFFYPKFFGLQGHYKLEGNNITLKIENDSLFSVYGRHEPNARRTTFKFVNFTPNSLIDFDGYGFNDVSNQPACISDGDDEQVNAQKIDTYAHNTKVTQFSLGHVSNNKNSYQTLANSQSLSRLDYSYDPVFNDFLLIFHRPTVDKNNPKGVVLTEKADMWLQMGQDVLSIQKLRLSEQQVAGMKQLGKEMQKNSEQYYLMDQDNQFSAQDIQSYQHKRANNRFYNKDLIVSDAQLNTQHHLTLYEKLHPSGQSMSEVFMDAGSIGACE